MNAKPNETVRLQTLRLFPLVAFLFVVGCFSHRAADATNRLYLGIITNGATLVWDYQSATNIKGYYVYIQAPNARTNLWRSFTKTNGLVLEGLPSTVVGTNLVFARTEYTNESGKVVLTPLSEKYTGVFVR